MDFNVFTLKHPPHFDVRAIITGTKGSTDSEMREDLSALHQKLDKAVPNSYRPKFHVTSKELVLTVRASTHQEAQSLMTEVKRYITEASRQIQNNRDKENAALLEQPQQQKVVTGMKPFTTLNAIAAPLPIDNVDTDMIIPKQFLKTIKRTGLKEGLFYEMRFDVNGVKNENFVLHNKPYDKAEILVSGANFGCGSSREHAPWALLDFGIRCVIAPSYADIFYNNCFKNGILPIVLPKEDTEQLMSYAEAGKKIAVDLDKQTVQAEGQNKTYNFDVEPFRKHCLLNGLDDIGLTLKQLDAIGAYEGKQKQQTPWLAA